MLRQFYLLINILFVGAFLTFISCDDDDEVEIFRIMTINAGDININTSSKVINVPINPTLVAEFSHNVNPTTITDSSVLLVRRYDNGEIPLNLSVSGKTVTITTKTELKQGTQYDIVFKNSIYSQGGLKLTYTSRGFTTEGTYSPDGLISYFAFEGTAKDSLGTHDPSASDVSNITYIKSKNDRSGLSASFNGSTSIIEIPNGDDYLSQNSFATSFWIKADPEQKGHYVLGLAGSYGFYFQISANWDSVSMTTRYRLANGETIAVENIYNGTGKTKDNGGFQGWTVNKDVTNSGGVGTTFFKDLWAHVVFAFDADTKESSIYINGELVKQQDFDLWPDGAPERTITGVTYAGNAAPGNELVLGFIQGRDNKTVTDPSADFSDPSNKQYKGLMDDVKLFSNGLDKDIVRQLYISERPE